MKSRIFHIFIFALLMQSVLFAQGQREINSGFEWLSLEDAQIKAAETGKKILLFGYAEWCTYCLKTRKETFPDSTVLASLEEHFIPAQIDAESEREIVFNGKSMPEYELARYLRLASYPTHYFLDSKGEILGAQPGFLEPFVYGSLLEYVGTDAFKVLSFEEYIEENKNGSED